MTDYDSISLALQGFGTGTQTNRTDSWGVQVEFSEGVVWFDAIKNNISTATTCRLYRKTGNGTGELLATADFVSDHAVFNYKIVPGLTYYLVADSKGASHDVRVDNSGLHYPYKNDHTTVQASVIMGVGNYTNSIDMFTNITTRKPTEYATSSEKYLRSDWDYPDQTPINLIPQEDVTSDMDNVGVDNGR